MSELVKIKDVSTKYAVTARTLRYYEDGDAPVGLMSIREGFEYEDFPQRDLGVCWIYGKSDEIYMEGIEDIAWKKLEQEGFEYLPDCGDRWIERYVQNRCTPDKTGYAISDICFFVKKG
jgi:hypothetical protein